MKLAMKLVKPGFQPVKSHYKTSLMASGNSNPGDGKSGNIVSRFLDDITDYLDEKGGYILTG